jgi:DNA-binding transcriptional MerR regulator
MKLAALRIGEVAARSGVSIDAVRFYERKKLLPPAPRSDGGFRLFPLETVERVRFIKQAQELGFSLGEVAELMTTGGAAVCRQVRDLLRAKLTELDERMRLMQEFRRTLAGHLKACEKELSERGKVAVCPVVVKISQPDVRRKKKR